MADKPSKTQLPFDFSSSPDTKGRDTSAPRKSETVVSAVLRFEQKRRNRHRTALDVVLNHAKSLRW